MDDKKGAPLSDSAVARTAGQCLVGREGELLGRKTCSSLIDQFVIAQSNHDQTALVNGGRWYEALT